MVGIIIAGVMMALIVCAMLRLRQMPKNNPQRFIRESDRGHRRIVACVGASTVQGQMSFNFVEYLSRKLEPQNFAFINAGINGDLAYNVLQRMPEVIACRPDYVVIAVAGNDIMGSLDARSAERYLKMKRLPCPPSIDWYEENIRKIIEVIRQNGILRIAVVSATILGEDVSSRANRAVESFNAVLEKIARETGVAFLNVYAKQVEYLEAHRNGIGPEYKGQVGPMLKAFLLHGLFGCSLDKISRKNGFLLNTDYIHQNSISGMMIAEEIERYVVTD